MLSPKSDPNVYDAFYFEHSCGRPYERSDVWLGFFNGIGTEIVSRIAPKTVLDAGCAMGFLVEALRHLGVEAWGVDISQYAIEQVHLDIRPYCTVGSVLEPLKRKYDLITCIEVLEHLLPDQAERATSNFCEHTDDVLFSSTPSDYSEPTHRNVQPPEYWAELFARQNFFRDINFDASFINPWAVRFRRKSEPVTRVVREYERKIWLLWKENVDLREVIKETRAQQKQALSPQSTLEPKAIRSSFSLENQDKNNPPDLLKAFLAQCQMIPTPSVLELGTRRVVPDQSTKRKHWVPHAKEFIGIDQEMGLDVDVMADIHQLSRILGKERFDIIISCSTFEHLKYPQLAAHEILRTMRIGGLLFIQTHQTFPLHAYPVDYFRFSREALAGIFGTTMGFRVIATDYEFPARIESEREPFVSQLDAFLNVRLFGQKIGPTPDEYIYEL